ncbi:MAG: polyprenyl synthetase family protein [Helicobacteraceae bacterium]|jgi:octaprenyl-diphosphate synthase|nr:polyprenyl synthetase family protein [Helicobacteraceae bacterium]
MNEIDNIISGFFEPTIREYIGKIPVGKRLRSRLICAIAKNSDRRFFLSAIVETIHLASLLHDDIIDDAKTRRGAPSVFVTDGAKKAILVGDIFYASAFAKLTEFESAIAEVIGKAVAKLAYGEFLDVKLSESFNADRERYENMIYLKTAALIEASCEAAAILANKDRESFRNFGRLLGVAFQTIDDVLDITHNETELGKPSLNDLSEGKVTLPLIDFYYAADKNNQKKLISLFGKTITKSDADWLRSVLEQSGSIARSRQYAKELLDDAKSLVAGDDELSSVADALIRRIK